MTTHAPPNGSAHPCGVASGLGVRWAGGQVRAVVDCPDCLRVLHDHAALCNEARGGLAQAIADTRALPPFHPDTQGAWARSMGWRARPAHVEDDEVTR